MALPVTITGISTAVAPVGPFKTDGAFVTVPQQPSLFTFGGATIQALRSGQTFTPASAVNLNAVRVYLVTVGTPTDGVVVNIYATSAGLPTGNSLGTSSSVAASALSATASAQTFTFASPIALSAGAVYAFVLSRTGAGDDTSYYRATSSVSTSVYAGGNIIFFSPGSGNWSSSPTQDLGFSLLGDPAYYFFGRDGTTATTLRPYKASDPTTTWGALGTTKTGFTTAILNIAGYQVGNVIHLLVSDGTASTSVAVKYVSFDTATDTFLATTETVKAAGSIAGAGMGAALYPSQALVVRSNGEVVAFFNGLQTKTSGTFYSRMYYSRRTAVNTWTAAVQVDANLAGDAAGAGAALGASDSVHFLWQLMATATSGLAQRTLTAANTLATASTNLANHSNAGVFARQRAKSYLDGGVTKIVVTAIDNSNVMRVVHFNSAATPTLIAQSVTFGAGSVVGTLTGGRNGRVLVNGTDVWAIFPEVTNSDVAFNLSTDGGANWETPVAVAYTVTAPGEYDTALSVDANIFQRGTSFILPYIVNDNGTWKYNEYDVTPPTVDAWNLKDKSANITLSNADKTATVAATGASGVHSTQTRMSATAGKYYTELKVEVAGGQLGTQVTATDETNGGFSNAYYVIPDGRIWSSTQVVGNIGSALAAGDVLCMASDFGGKLYWFRKNNGFWNNSATADPATGIGGLAYFGSAVPISLWFGGGAIGSSATIRTELTDLTLQGPAGYSTWMGEVIPAADGWNISDKSGTVTLSDGDKTATVANPGDMVRSTKKLLNGTPGKYYAEFLINNRDGINIGLQDATVAISTATASFWVENSGICYLFNSSVGSVITGGFVAGDVVSIAWDAGAELIWFRKNNGSWNNVAPNSADNGTSGKNVSAAPSTNHAVWFFSGGSNGSVTIRLSKDEFTQTTPVGFLSWMGETLVIPDMGTLVSDVATIAGVGNVEWAGTGNLAPQRSTVIGLSASSSTGTGALAAVAASSTNYIPWSQELDHSPWYVHPQLNLIPNGAVAPDGTATSERVTSFVGNNLIYLGVPLGTRPSGNYTASVYVKASAGWLQFYDNGYQANFNLATGTLGTIVGGTAAITNAGNGWYRCSYSAYLVTPSFQPQFYLLDGNGAGGDNCNTAGMVFDLWGVQYNDGLTPSLYVPTQANTASLIATLIGSGTVSWNATGAIVAGSRTNLARWSETIDLWTPTDVVVAADNIAAPNGSMTADRVTDAATSNHHLVGQVIPGLVIGQSYTHSIYAKAGTRTWLQLYCNAWTGWVNFDLANGVVGLSGGGAITSMIQKLPDGWYRISITGISEVASGTVYALLKPGDISGIATYVGNGSSLYLWGEQFESGITATPYTPTTTAPVTVGTPAVLVGTGTVTTPPAYGTGALTTGPAGLAGLGVSSSVGTASLVASGKTRTNYFLYSQQFDIGTWTKAASVITAENATAPDNTLTADLLTDTVASTNHYIMQSGVGNTAPVGTNTYSIYVKPKTLTWIQLRVSDTDTFWANFNIVTGAKGLDSANGLTTVITPVGNGWYRCSVTFPHPQTNWNATCFVIMQVADETISSFVGTGLSAWLWGAQYESSGQATAYIPTIGSVVSVTDVLTGVGLINNTGTGVLVVTQPATLSGEGGIQWNATGVLASHPAIVVGAGKAVDPPTTGTGALVSLGIAAVAGTGISASIGGSKANDIVIYGGTKNQYTWGRTSVSGIGQVFIATGPVVSQITPYIGKVLTPTDSVVVKLYSAVNGLPGTLLGTSDPILGSNLPNSNSEPVTFTFPTPIPVQNGASYVVTFTRTGAFDANGYYLNGYTATSIYAGGGMITMSSGSWNTSASIYDTWTTISQSHTKGLVPSDATITAPGGFVEYIATGALVNDPAIIESIGSVVDGPAHGTGVLVNLGIANVVGVAVSGSVGAPNLQPSNSSASGVGVTKVDGSAVLTSSNAAVNSIGLVRDIIKGPGVLAAGASALTASGTAMTPAKGDGVLVVTNTATVTGSGIVEWNVTGTGVLTNADPSVLIAQGKSETRGTGALTSTSTIVGGGFIRWIVTGALVQSRPTVAGIGLGRTIGSGAIVASNTAAVTGTGNVFSGVSGIGTLTSFATLSAIGRSESNGLIGTLPSSAASVTGVSTSLSSGAAVLSNLPSVLAASGRSIFIATGALVDQSAIISGVGSARWMMSGTLPASTATLTALGLSRWTGTGTLVSAAAAATGSGFGQAIGTGALPAAPATLVSFEGVTVISGTGALQVGASAVAGVGYPRWFATGALAATASTLTGSGIVIPKTVGAGDLVALTSAMAGAGGSIWRMSGALVSAPAVVAATGIGAVQGTAPLLAARSTVYGYEGVSLITGTGALQSQSYLATGLGFSRTSGAGTLTEAPFGVVGEGLNQSTGAGVLLDVQSALSGTGLSATGGLGVLGSMATVSGSGQAQWLGSGVLTSDIAGLVATAVSGSRGVATLGVGLSTLSAIGQSNVQGTAVLTSSSAIITGFANLVSSGSGVLVTEDHVLAGAGLQFASGWGQLYAYRFEIEGIGQTWNTGFGNLISHYPALMLGRGAVSSNAIGVLQSGPAKIIGGSVQTIGLGVLLAQRSSIHGVGYVETITPPVEGEWVPTPLPPSYHGVASWGGASMVRPWVNPGIQPWRRVG
jgi:hypothetical protein